MNKIKQFDFGQNWHNFSQKKLSKEKIEIAKADFLNLTKNIKLENKTFLDIGFGQGLSLLIAKSIGAKVVACDINKKCKIALEYSKIHFNVGKIKFPVIIGSILENSVVEQIIASNPVQKDEKFDIVHSWGVLHHTGSMYKAIDNTASLVNNNGYLILAIYKSHWTSPVWHFIKKTYNYSPNIIKKLLLKIFVFLLLIKNKIIGKQNNKRRRGMDFYSDAIDWLGGYPYEYATKEQIVSYLQNEFKLINYIPDKGRVGCNQFVFKRV